MTTNDKPGLARKTAIDPVSGETFFVTPESRSATVAACVSGAFLVASMCGLLWLLNDCVSERHRFLIWLSGTTTGSPVLVTATMKILLLSFLGGGLGAVVNEFRSFVRWHSELGAFGVRFFWKTITSPWIGGLLAMFATALVTGGVTVVGGTFAAETTTPQQMLSVFSIGALAGYGARDVSKWLDVQVKTFFSIKSEQANIEVPDLMGMTLEEAKKALEDQKLVFDEQPGGELVEAARVGKIVAQSPPSKSKVAAGSRVSLSVGRLKP